MLSVSIPTFCLHSLY